ncbi:MAG: hypothetical protein L6308_01145 [Candidatus Omnitrophica bacterium]|nr:hypothetical protein [Candidatus Omnitrophota bacterium]
MFNLLIILILIIVVVILVIRKVLKKDIIIEGIVIGVVTGICLSFSIDANYRASLIGPIIQMAKFIKVSVRYVSVDYKNIQLEKVGEGVFNVDATNIASGVVVKFRDSNLSDLPPDLRYDVATSDTVQAVLTPNSFKLEELGGKPQ